MWSPDGSQIAFERLGADSCMVYIVPSLGGAEREVGRCHNYTTFYFDWTPDASALITAERGAGAATGMALLHWDLASGAKRPLHYQRTAADQDLEAHYSPDGSLIAFRRGLAPYSDLCVMAAAGGAVRQLTQLHSRIRGYAWTADGRGLVFASNHEGRFALYTVGLDSGAVRPLGVGPAEYPASERHGDSIVYEIPRTTNRLAWVRLGADRAVPELLAQSTGSDDSPALAPDGSRIAFISDRNGHPQIWLYDFAASAAMALTDFRDALLIGPTWSADGKRLLVTVRNSENPGLVEIDLATRRQRIVSAPGDDVLSGSYGVGDDDYLLVIGASSRHNTLVHLEHAGSASPRRTLLTSGIEHMEPDAHGGRVYYTKNARPGLFSLPLGGGEETLVTTLVDTSQIDGWRIVDGRIWYMSQVAWKPVDLIEFDPATGARRVLGHLQTELHDVAFSPTPARDRVVIVALGAEDTDIGAFRLRSGE
jgi:Tol biopolymer transport system component